MADTSRKRSRKSKLVPRECSVDEDDLELQIPVSKLSKTTKQKPSKLKKPEPPASKPESTALKPESTALKPESTAFKPEPSASKPEEVCDTSVLRKINASVRKSTESEDTLPRKFEVNIEVESCNDHDYFFGQELLSPSTIIGNSLVKKHANPTPIPLTLEFILDAVDNLETSTNIADKILNIYVRNTIGYEHRKKLVQNYHERQIQETLDDWRSWQSRSFYREDPLFYKCYICTRSYWHLSKFRNHLSTDHRGDKRLNICLEKYERHEANMIAYHEKLVVIKDIYTHGLCYRCGKDYDAHAISSRFDDNFYRQEGCPKQFACCTGLRDHFRTCTSCNVQGKPFKCDICKSRFDTNDELAGHLVLCHSVRSDVPIMTRYESCKFCSERYECRFLHNCVGKRFPNFECPHCFISFSNALTLGTHTKNESKPYKCEICGEVMPFNCMKYDHMLTHTDNYMEVKKCMICSGLNVFLSKEDAKNHWTIKHKILDLRKRKNVFFPKLFVPWSCIYQRLAEIDLKQQESLLEAQESVSEVKEELLSESEHHESGPENKESGPENKESGPENKESGPENKESGLEHQQSGLEHQQSGPEDQESGPEDQESGPEEDNVLLAEQESDLDGKKPLLDIQENSILASLQEELDAAREFIMDDVVVKEEPEDIGSPGLVIKEEPLEEVDNQMFEEENQTENFEDQITVKQETVEAEEEEELDEYEGDLIKLNFNIEDMIVKEETVELEEGITNESQDLDFETEESQTKGLLSQAEDSMLEPVIIITGEHRKNRRLYRCTTCGFEAKHKEYRQHIDYDCSKNPVKHRSFNCTKCNTEFGSMKKFLAHFEKHGYPRVSCPECLKQFKNFTYLGQHVQTHVKRNFVRVKMITYAGDTMARPDYQCKKCSENVDFPEFFDHWETHIKAEPSHLVTVISKPKKRDIHGQLHETIIKDCIAHLHKQPKECNHCHRLFKRINECKRHIIEHLLVDAYNQKHIYKELRCQICDSGFHASDKYKQHMRDHASLPVYKCELCDRTFSDSSNFTKHKKVHNLRVVVCDLCGTKFQSKLSLEKHIEKHQNSKPIVCESCNKVFYFESSYRRHVRHFHEKITTGFRCVICGDRFLRLKDKWDHMWYAHKERKHKADCPICLQSFRKYSDVRAHAKAVHEMGISVLSVKKATGVLSKKRDISNLDKCVSNSKPVIKVGRVSETLVVYDSD